MWGDAGHAYVYLIYGVHHCLNVVTVGGGAGEAVLVRGGVVVHGHELACRRRGSTVAERSLADGPGKLCQALATVRGDDGLISASLGGGVRRRPPAGAEVGRSTPRRVGSYAGQWPLRLTVIGDAFERPV
jgi:DNA-3-methyladenine glycosylase